MSNVTTESVAFHLYPEIQYPFPEFFCPACFAKAEFDTDKAEVGFGGIESAEKFADLFGETRTSIECAVCNVRVWDAWAGTVYEGL